MHIPSFVKVSGDIWRLTCCLVIPAFAIAVAAAPAQAMGEPGDYRYCRTAAPADGSLSLLRTVRRDGSFAFQSSIGKSFLPRHHDNFRAYFAWPKSPADPARLWIVHSSDDFNEPVKYIPPGSSLVFFGAGKDRDATLGTIRDKNDFEIFETRADTVLRRFPNQHALRFAIYGPDKNGVAQKHPIIGSTLDLDALRTQLSEAEKLGPALMQCADEIPDLPREADIAQYTNCRVQFENGYGTYSVEPYQLSWSYRISTDLWLSAERRLWVDETPDAFLSSMKDPFASLNPLQIQLRNNGTRYSGGTDLSVELTAGDRHHVVGFGDSATLEWQQLIDLAGTEKAIDMIVRDRAARIVERATIPTSLFAGADAQWKVAAARLTEIMKDPMANCAPEWDLIIT